MQQNYERNGFLDEGRQHMDISSRAAGRSVVVGFYLLCVYADGATTRIG